jgi:mono/diheme cytochrome c family protein
MMKRISGLLVVIAASGAGVGATLSLLPGDASRGKELFRAWSCNTCHNINGEGGKSAPDLGKRVERGFSPSVMAGLMWNHAPAMWAGMERKGVARPEPGEQQAADLFVYLFAARFFEQPGDARRGRQVFAAKRCGTCHGATSPLREGIRPVSAWEALADPIALAQRMWNHSRDMRLALDGTATAYPRLSAQELTDLLAYLRSTVEHRPAGEIAPPPAQAGAELFATKGCAGCHRGALALEARATRYGLTGFASAMWNHPFGSRPSTAQLSYGEMRELVGYLVSTQFFEERGDPDKGRKVFAEKRCIVCHDNPSSGAPARSTMDGTMTSFGMVAAVWKHGPAMLKRMRAEKIAWPHFSDSEMADVTAYLHGVEFKRRRIP